ncbi:efflux RND transporter periplasmic adaptor subunit [Achromobacter aegrifaciens]|uniref:efflux RND transporter periplasmic adaptor subunit n=1 Tax=Achromobacter aegrifaciens TaxID=1287736 RepID=UPI0027B975FA|nr:efflux RND transporter periplasmic adaptor subunit [Achromobacter aegrifaciens]WLW59065.1 efflux RND transporter periplasmic adaptor subunit [Achromobacter aegrifaciens]
MSQNPNPAPQRAARRKLALTATLVLAAIGSLYLYDTQRKAAAQAAPAGEAAPIPVVVAPARAEVLPATLQAIGTIVAEQQVLVAPEVAGRVTAIHFTSGQEVAAGLPLVQINDGPVRRELDRHRASAALAQANLDRAKRLLGQTMSRAEYEQHAALHAETKALVAQAEEGLAQRLVRAPFTGTLGLRLVNLGQYVEAGTPIATLTDARLLHVDFTVPDRHAAALRLGLDVAVVSAGGGQAQLRGKLSAIDPLVDAGNRALKVRATLAPDAAGRLSPGAYAQVSVALPAGPATLTVPAEAVQSTLSGATVYTMRNDDPARVRLVSVQTGASQHGKVALSDTDLRDGDLVVIAGQINLHDGAAVRPRLAGE